MNHADPNRSGEPARNVAVALRFKHTQGKPEMPQVEKEVLAAGYDRARGGNLHLANNARDTGMVHPGLYLRKALPDRVDVIERVIADGDRVGLLFRVTATHTGGFFGVPASGRKLDVYEVAFLRLQGGQLVEGWFMMDEAELLRQMGASLPQRPDGRIIAPPPPDGGEAVDALVRRIGARADLSPRERNMLAAAAACRALCGAGGIAGVRCARHGFQHLRDYSRARGLGDFDLDAALSARSDSIEVLMAEGEEVWMRYSISGTHTGNLCGIAPTGRRVGVHVAALIKFGAGGIVESWAFADEFALLLQLGRPNLLME